MAAPSYTSDLTDIFTDGSTTGWTALGGGASGLNQETDYFIQGTSCISKNAFASSERGMIYNAGSTTVATGEAIYCWVTHHTPASLADNTTGGLKVLVGSATGTYDEYFIAGSDTINYGAPWLCGVVDPTIAGNAGNWTNSATFSYVGCLANLPSGGPTKGSPLGIDGIRHGRTLSCTDGDLANGYATFAGAAQENDYNDVTNGYNRWGQFQKTDTGAFLMQCQFEIGTTATACDFRDSNRSIVINNTPFVSSGFNEFAINNASTNVELSNTTIQALGTTSRGNWVHNANATVSLDSVTFVDMGTFSFGSNTTVTSCTFRRTQTITTNSASLVGCTISNNTSAVSVATSNLADLDDCTFISDGSNHAVELGTSGSPLSTQTMNWNNTVTGYATTDGSTGNEVIKVYVADNNTLTINASGSGTVSIYNASTGNGAVSVVTGQVDVTVEVLKPDSTALTTQDANVYLVAASGGSLSVGTQIIKGFTDATGKITDTRSYATAQPVTGWVRKSTSSPYYKQYDLTGTVSTVNGLLITAQMVSDE